MAKVSRRSVAKWIGCSVIIPLSGCQGDFPSHRTLSTSGIQTEKINDEWRLNVTVVADLTGRYHNTGSTPFNDVVLLGFSRGGSQICDTRIGDIPDTEMRYEEVVTLRCTELPHYLTFTAEETPCDEDTTIERLVYDPTEEVYTHEARECDGPLVPE